MRTRIAYLGFGAEMGLLAWLAVSPALVEEMQPGVTIYGLCVAVSVLVGMMIFAAGQRREAERALPGALVTAAVLVPCALLGARILYCAIRLCGYYMETGLLHMLNFREGGYLLYGAMLGAAAGAACLTCRSGKFPRAMDELAIPGLAVIALCRLAEGFACEGLGGWVEDEALWHLPFASLNSYGEYQWAVFIPEAIAALIVLFLCRKIRKGKGERALSALALYAAFQIILESMRMDSVLKIGFVRVSQVLSAAALLFVILIRLQNRKLSAVLGTLAAFAACAAIVGGLEWALDKTQISPVILYAAMFVTSMILVSMGRSRKKT